MKIFLAGMIYLTLVCSNVLGDFITNHGPSVGIEDKIEEPNLNRNYPGFLGGNNKGIQVTSRCEKKGDKYEYTYKIKNVGEVKMLVGWSIPDRVIGLSGEPRDIAHWYKLKPGEEAKIKVLHKDAPAFCMGMLYCHDKDKHNGIDEWCKEHGASFSGTLPTYFFQMAAGQPGLVPKEMLPKKKEK
jgi:hypothetical protein